MSKTDQATRDRHEIEMICPRCHRLRVARLRCMARHSELDWFKCEGCEHIFTRPRPAHDQAPGNSEPVSVAETDASTRRV